MGIARRSTHRRIADPARVIHRLFIPGLELVGGGESRSSGTIERVLALDEDSVDEALADVFERFSLRHENLTVVFEHHAARILDHLTVSPEMSPRRRQLLGATFTHEYSLEGASVCNPSVVRHFDQSTARENELRLIVSFRAVGEGHRSSICFATGMIDAHGDVRFDPAQPFPVVATIGPAPMYRDVFHAKLSEVGADGEIAASVLSDLGDTFTDTELEAAIARRSVQGDTRLRVVEAAGLYRLIASAFYSASFDARIELSRRILWPATTIEAQGVEDARFVFLDDGANSRYVATYTAFDGANVTQQLLETTNFETFASSPLGGVGASNKGLAVFPRKIDGRFVALSRHDRQSNYIVSSDDLHCWNDIQPLQEPRELWEIVQLGNCGAPIEVEEGWLVLTHGVGPMRTYGIGVLLLDRDEPTRILGRLPRPLLLPAPNERDGYVPNVVYSCGSLVHDRRLFVPYGISDCALSHASVAVDTLLDSLVTP